MGSEIKSDAKLKTHAVKRRENIMIQREKINRLMTTKRLLEQVERI